MSKNKKHTDLTSKYLIVDIESTCWREPKDQPPGEKNEIIEIGLTTLSFKDLTLSPPVSIIVKPCKSKISPFCTQLTTLTQEMVDGGISFLEACEKLMEEHNSKNIPWVSWGMYDRKHFLYQCGDMKIPYPFGAGHWDFRNMFALMMGLEKKVSLPEASKLLGLEFDGTLHRGVADAHNIGKIMVECFGRIRGKYVL